MGTNRVLSLIALACALGGARASRAQDEVPVPPPPWEITGTSTTASPPEAPPTHRVDRRLLQKNERLVIRAGLAYLSRADYYESPGMGVAATYYTSESVGIDILSGTLFFSQLGTTARALRERTGLLPDSQRPYARITSGARLSFAYGKLLVDLFDVVVHLDASAAAHLGVLVTDEAMNPGGDLGLMFQAAVLDRFLISLEASYFMSYEKRTSSSFASGPLATLGVGVLF